MKNYAEINSENIVERILVVSEADGIDWLESNLGGRWIETTQEVGKIAGEGYFYDEKKSAFIPPKPFDSWTLDEETFSWLAPKPMPKDGDFYWDEEKQEWTKIEF